MNKFQFWLIRPTYIEFDNPQRFFSPKRDICLWHWEDFSNADPSRWWGCYGGGGSKLKHQHYDIIRMVARFITKLFSSSFTISGMLKMSQQIKVRVWPLWNQKLNKDIMERFIIFSWTPTQIWTKRDIFVKDHFPSIGKQNTTRCSHVDKLCYSV